LPDSDSILRITCGHREQICPQASRLLFDYSAVIRMEPSQEPQQVLGRNGKRRELCGERTNEGEVLRLNGADMRVRWSFNRFCHSSGVIRADRPSNKLRNVTAVHSRRKVHKAYGHARSIRKLPVRWAARTTGDKLFDRFVHSVGAQFLCKLGQTLFDTDLNCMVKPRKDFRNWPLEDCLICERRQYCRKTARPFMARYLALGH